MGTSPLFYVDIRSIIPVMYPLETSQKRALLAHYNTGWFDPCPSRIHKVRVERRNSADGQS